MHDQKVKGENVYNFMYIETVCVSFLALMRDRTLCVSSLFSNSLFRIDWKSCTAEYRADLFEPIIKLANNASGSTFLEYTRET